MGKGFGIAAFVFVLISFPIPILGNYITLGALLLAAVGAANGDSVWAIATTVISGVKLFFLSPTWHLMMFGAAYMKAVDQAIPQSAPGGPPGLPAIQPATVQAAHVNQVALIMTLLFLAAPIVTMLLTQRQAAAPKSSTPHSFEPGEHYEG